MFKISYDLNICLTVFISALPIESHTMYSNSFAVMLTRLTIFRQHDTDTTRHS